MTENQPDEHQSKLILSACERLVDCDRVLTLLDSDRALAISCGACRVLANPIAALGFRSDTKRVV